MAKKQEECKCEEGLPLWMATFSDLMTLLLCFFVLLLSFANMDIVKFKESIGSLKDAFGVQRKREEFRQLAWSPSDIEKQKELDLQAEDKQVMEMVFSIKETLDEKGENEIQVSPDNKGVLLRVDSGVLFGSGSATLKPQAAEVLKNIVDIMKKYNYNVIVRGHTDNVPIRHSKFFPSNWELSAARAAATLRFLVGNDISSTRMKAVGYAGTRPIVPNNTPGNRTINRRVEFYFHRPGTETW